MGFFLTILWKPIGVKTSNQICFANKCNIYVDTFGDSHILVSLVLTFVLNNRENLKHLVSNNTD